MALFLCFGVSLHSAVSEEQEEDEQENWETREEEGKNEDEVKVGRVKGRRRRKGDGGRDLQARTSDPVVVVPSQVINHKLVVLL